jgi:two-component system phosphate regulon sensor histidine kinase PhoR
MMLDLKPHASTHSLLSALIAALPGPVIVVTEDMRITATNGPARDILPSVRAGDLLALSLRDPHVLDGVKRVHASGLTETVAWRDRVPVERSYEVTIAALDMPQEPRAVVLTIRDLTEAHRVERMRVDFVANASHELRTPLASLLGFVETLQGPARDDPKARERFLAIMGDQARRMARLVDDLLSLSRIEQNLHLKPSQSIDFGAVVRHVCDTLAPLAQETGARVEVNVPEPVIVAGDRDELVRVAENLIENAIKYGCMPRRTAAAGTQPCPGLVEVSVLATRRAGVLTVRDHGPGIAPEHLPRLTERFYRVDAGQSRAKGGTGLGLAIVKHIVARHRGRMTVDSEVGDGAIFTASIPLHPQNMR